MDLSKFEIFLAVAETKSFTKAAIACHLTPSAISKHIKAFEDQTKVNLFERTTRAVKLTPEGKLLHTQCLRLQKELDDTRELANRMHGKPSGILRIATNYFFGERYLFPAIQKFQQLYPQLSIEIIYDEFTPPEFSGKQVDLALGFSLPAATDDIVMRALFKTYYLLCGTKKYFAKNKIPQLLDDLNQHYYINHTGRRGFNQPYFKQAYRDFPLKTSLWLDQSSAMLAAVKQNIGIAHLQEYAIRHELQSGEVIAVLPKYQLDDVTCYLYYSKPRYVQPKVRAFVDFILEVFKQ